MLQQEKPATRQAPPRRGLPRRGVCNSWVKVLGHSHSFLFFLAKLSTSRVATSLPLLSRAVTITVKLASDSGGRPVNLPVPGSKISQSGNGPFSPRASMTTETFGSACLKVSFGKVKLNSAPAGISSEPKLLTLMKPPVPESPAAVLLELFGTEDSPLLSKAN